RSGGGPTLIEAKTYRLKGHFVGDPEKYRKDEDVEKHWPEEPIARFEKHLIDKGFLSEEEKEVIWKMFAEEMDEAVKFAQESPFPPVEDALTDLFVDDTGYDYY
ncbi:MAG: thiamine pyrophosphate-dependent enzyme, partial [Halanaerobium sp.]|nr:thiamine pyrophosphate-dependent enzyme [Halanaerobium sp.]